MAKDCNGFRVMNISMEFFFFSITITVFHQWNSTHYEAMKILICNHHQHQSTAKKSASVLVLDYTETELIHSD